MFSTELNEITALRIGSGKYFDMVNDGSVYVERITRNLKQKG